LAAVLTGSAAALGLLAGTAVASPTSVTVSPRDNCGGFNGHVVWQDGSGSYVQVYGEVWDVHCPGGSTSLWLSWDDSQHHNVNAKAATNPNTVGVNYKTPTPTSPQDVKVTVCSTSGGWHCGTPVDVGTSAGSGPTGAAPPPANRPPVTVPVPTPVPQPTPQPKRLRVKLAISWTWVGGATWLHRITVGTFPRRTHLSIRCRGRGCPRGRVATATGPRRVRRLLHELHGRRYRAGDTLVITLSAPGWRPERAQIKIRRGRLPRVRLLAR
jgi:hypothetical protein